MSTCGTCAGWTPPSDRTGFRDAITLNIEVDYDVHDSQRDDPRQIAVDQAYGECRAVRLVDRHNPEESLPLATVRDLSDADATLYTQAGFGCVLHQPRWQVGDPVVVHGLWMADVGAVDEHGNVTALTNLARNAGEPR